MLSLILSQMRNWVKMGKENRRIIKI